MPSLSGTTKESAAMLNTLKQIGAQVITLIGHADTPLGLGGDPALLNFAADDTSSESFYIQALLVALSVMKARGEIDNYDAILAEMQALPQTLLATKRNFEPKADHFAQIIAGSNYHMFTAAGNMWPAANYYATCILEEMQWALLHKSHEGFIS